ncbi:MAG: hypothetical protein SGJ23_12820 [Alphaproteobacteria bacterium]|nr:hypothetical protein [Alphaproteobacteria bacterium]
MSKVSAPKRSAARVAAAAPWRRDLAASLMLATGIFIGTLSFAGVWAATHPALALQI